MLQVLRRIIFNTHSLSKSLILCPTLFIIDFMLRTKIIATFGPAISEPSVLTEALKIADIIRFNFSHGTPEEKLQAKELVEKTAKKLNRNISLLADLPGPKIRVSKLENDIYIKTGQEIVFVHHPNAKGDEIPIELDIYDDMKVGCEISIGDGNPKLIITKLKDRRIFCKSLQDGKIGSRKGINVKGINMSASPPTSDDLKLIEFVKKHGFDYIALSFVKSAEDVKKARKISGNMLVISKIERQEAINDIENIVAVSDGVMIARGDMALNIEFNEVPLVQDKIINACRKNGKPVIVATQMLESMTRNQSPTRAEMTDIANAVKSGTDCIMLSDETAVGKFPIDALKAMSSIASYTETMMSNDSNTNVSIKNTHEGIAAAAAGISRTCKTDAIFIITKTGSTAKLLSSLRPESSIIAVSDSEELFRSFGIFYGLRGVDIPISTNEEVIKKIKEYAKKLSILSYIIVFGHTEKSGTSDTILCFWEKNN